MLSLFLLILYSALPALVTGSSIEQAGLSTLGWGLFFFQLGAGFLLFRQKRRDLTIVGTILFFATLLTLSFYGGGKIHTAYYRLIYNFYPGPLLTVTFVLIYKLSRRRDFRKLARGLNRIIILLISYSTLLLTLTFQHIFTSDQIMTGREIFFSFYEAVNYLPALFFLRILRNSSQKRLNVENERVWFQNEEITSLFSGTEIFILRFILKNRSIHCHDIVPVIKEKMKEGFSCTPPDCKASLCPAYAIIYRQIKSLDKKLDNLSIGLLSPPENKRDIVEQGWQFYSHENVITTNKKNLSLNIPMVSQISEREKNFIPGIILTILLGLICPFLMTLEAYARKSVAGQLWPILPISLFLSLLFLQPLLVRPHRGFYLRMMLSIALLLCLPLLGIPFLGENTALFLSIRNMGLLITLFLIRFPHLETLIDGKKIKEKAPEALFWSIWFFMIILALFRDPMFSEEEKFHRNTFNILEPLFFNRLMLFSLFALSVGFFSLSKKPLVLGKEKIDFNQKPLPLGLSTANLKILRELIFLQGESLHCHRIIAMISPDEAKTCHNDCKPSVCPLYQKTYKRIQAIRKYLQIAGIGTIISPERRASSHEEGWRLALYDDIFIKIESS